MIFLTKLFSQLWHSTSFIFYNDVGYIETSKYITPYRPYISCKLLKQAADHWSKCSPEAVLHQPALPILLGVNQPKGLFVKPQNTFFTLFSGVDGGFSRWGFWFRCSLTCGDGVQTRTRTCTDPPPQGYGEDCDGPLQEIRACNDKPCPGSKNSS